MINTPIFQQKGETQLGGHISFNGWEGQGAYALTNNLALLANYNDNGQQKRTHSAYNIEEFRHNFAEGGAGFYHKTKRGKTIEVFALAGWGMSSHYVTSGSLALELP